MLKNTNTFIINSMFIYLFTLFAFFTTAFAGVVAQGSKSVTANLKESDGLNNLNLKCDFPFKINDYVLGFRHKFGSEGLTYKPDAIFVKKSFDTGDVGSLVVDAELASKDYVFSAATKWISSKWKIALGLEANSKDLLTNVDFSSDDSIQGTKLNTYLGYDLKTKTANGKSAITKDDTTVEIAYDTDKCDPELSVLHKFDDNNAIQPSVYLLSKEIKSKYIRSWDSGSLSTTLHPGTKLVVLEWNDISPTGVWKTKATVPLADVKTAKFSVSRDWKV